MATRKLTTTDGTKSIITTLDDNKAKEICAKYFSGNDFLRKISAVTAPTQNQNVWLHIYAMQYVQQNLLEVPNDTFGFKGLFDLFTNVKKLQSPKFNVLYGGLQVQAMLYPPRHQFAGSIKLTNGLPFDDPSSLYYGRITPEGKLLAKCNVPNAVIDVIKRFASDPVEMAKDYGRLTGNCCFCLRSLKADNSVEVGYGPICAEHWGLPWG